MITSVKNPLVKRVAGLHRSRARRADGVFLIEGERELRCAAAAGVRLENVLYCPDLLAGNKHFRDEPALHAWSAQQAAPPELTPVSDTVYARIAYRQGVEGLIAVAAQPDWSLAALKLPAAPLLVVVEGVEKPGNLGAVLRTADAAGADAVIVCDAAVDVFNPNVVRASLGALFTVPVATAEAAAVRTWLTERGLHVVVTTPTAETIYTDLDLRPGTAVVFGSEHAGVENAWREATTAVSIPMCGHMDSLNLSASVAVVLYEALRQRRMPRR